jgi:predicted metal-dependent phosphoesterase TrpH
MTPNNIVNMACLKGLDAIAVTDHNAAGNVRAVTRAAEGKNLIVIAGMEIETAEEVHVLSLFPSVFAAETAEAEVQARLPRLQNDSAIFGRQLLFDENDRVTAEEPRLLITAAALSIAEVFALVRRLGGLPVAAHIDRDSYSVLSNLGGIPEELGAVTVEISRAVEHPEEYLLPRPELRGCKIMRNSDAHRLGDLSERVNSVTTDGNSAADLLRAFG